MIEVLMEFFNDIPNKRARRPCVKTCFFEECSHGSPNRTMYKKSYQIRKLERKIWDYKLMKLKIICIDFMTSKEKCKHIYYIFDFLYLLIIFLYYIRINNNFYSQFVYWTQFIFAFPYTYLLMILQAVN